VFGAASPPFLPPRDEAKSERLSTAVLPFTNMSGDPGQQYFSDGITEDIITELSRFHRTRVQVDRP
jgi:adenylate cyclase